MAYLQKTDIIYKTISVLSVILILIVWQLASIKSSNSLLVPSPIRVLVDLEGLIGKELFWIALANSLYRIILAFILSFFLSLLIGVAAGKSKAFYAFILPYLVIMRSTPVISFILLALIWFTSSNVAIFIAFLIMFPLLCFTIIQGVQCIDNQLIEMSNVYAFTSKQRFMHVYIPGIAPFLISGTSNALGMGWRAVIIGEVISQPIRGLGTNLHLAHSYLQVSELIAYTIAAISIGYIFEYTLRKSEKYFAPWKSICHD